MRIEIGLPYFRLYLGVLYLEEDWTYIMFPLKLLEFRVMVADKWRWQVGLQIGMGRQKGKFVFNVWAGLFGRNFHLSNE